MVVDLLQSGLVGDSVRDNGVPLQPRIEDCAGGLTQKGLRLVQRRLQTDAQTQQPIPGGVPAAGKHLVEIDLTRVGPTRQRRLGQRAPGVQLIQQRGDGTAGEGVLIFRQILVQIGLAEHTLAEIIGGFELQGTAPLYF